MKSTNTSPFFSKTNFGKFIFYHLVLFLIGINLFAQQEIELKGKITELGSDYLIVNNLTFNIDQNTEFEGSDNLSLTFTNLQTGDIVEVKGYRQSDGSILAVRVKLEDDLIDQNEFEITGFVTELGVEYLVIGGYKIFVNTDTDFDDSGVQITFSQLEVGDLLEVKARIETGSKLVAVRIHREDDGNDDNGAEIELTDRIKNITANSIFLGEWEFVVSDQTEILGRNKEILSFSDLKIGSRVEVKAYMQRDGSYLAVRVKLEDDSTNNEVEFSARIESIEKNNIVLRGITFETDEKTEFFDNDRNPTSINALALRMWVEVKGFKRTDGTYYASRVKIEDLIKNEVEVKGPISEINEKYLVVNSNLFAADETTLVLDRFNNLINYSDLRTGLLVEVKGVENFDGALKAVRIKLEDSSSVDIFGQITSIDGSSFVVSGLTVYVSANTLFLDPKNQEIKFAALKVDYFVEVELVKNTDGLLTALKVKIESGFDFSKLNSQVTSVSIMELGTALSNYNLSSSTIVLDNELNIISINELTEGDVVTIWAQTNGVSDKTALQILKGNTSVTSVNGDELLAKSFSLEQNYPNPFNPTTTISFSLQSDQAVSLKVFNTIGQEVAELVNSKLASGSYSVTFDAAGLSSGLYLYRLESGSQVQVKKMMLLK